jgi:hypothetical protein
VNDDILAGLPISGRRNSLGVDQLEGVHGSQNFIKVAASGSRIRQNQADNVLGIQDEHRSNREWHAFFIHIRCILTVEHVKASGDVSARISYDRKFNQSVLQKRFMRLL